MPRLTRAPGRLGSAPLRLRPAPKVANAFYLSPEWIALRERRKKDPDYAAAKARAKPGERVVLDHIREIRDGGAKLDPANTQWLTFAEHQRKTEQAKRARLNRRKG